MSTKLLMRFGAAALTLGLCATIAADSLATDDKYYHGTECVQRGTTDPDISYGPGGFKNNAATAKDFLCPIVRDQTTSDVTDWDVAVDRNGNAADWSIYLKSCDRTGEHCTVKSITVPAGGELLLDGVKVENHTFNGSLFLLSSVPAGALIHSYHVNESNGTE